MKFWKTTNVTIGLLLTSVFSNAQAESRTLYNLERERSELISSFVDTQLNPAERQNKIVFSQRRLLDMERMVIRDDRLLGAKDPVVQQAFAHYDRTFLVHASAEANRHIVDFWLEQLQLDTESVLQSKKGHR